jgi:hypothetical protein
VLLSNRKTMSSVIKTNDARKADSGNAKKSAKAGFKLNPLKKWVPSSIDLIKELTLDEMTLQVLAKARCSLSIVIDRSGTRTVLTDLKGSAIGGIDDLKRLGKARAFLTQERASGSSEVFMELIHRTLFRVYGDLLTETPGRTDFQIWDANWFARVKPLIQDMETIYGNLKKIQTNLSDSRVATDFLLQCGVKALRASIQLLRLHMVGAPEKGQIKALLFTEGVPKYVYAKLKDRMVLEPGTDLTKILFPMSLVKGLSLSLKEWRTDAFWNRIPEVLRICNAPFRRLLKNDVCLKAMLGLAAEFSFTDETNLTTKKLLEVGVIMAPWTPHVIIESGEKGKMGAIPFSGGNGPMDRLQNLSSAYLRLITGKLTSDNGPSMFAKLVAPGLVLGELVPGNNLYHKWHSMNTANPWKCFFQGGLDAYKRCLVRLLASEARITSSATILQMKTALGLTADAVLAEADADALVVTDDNLEDEPNILNRDQATWREALFGGIENYFQPLSAEVKEAGGFITYSNRFIRKTDKLRSAPVGRSRLTKTSKDIVKEVSKSKDSDLAGPIEDWLRGFEIEEIQSAAAEVVIASLEKLLALDANEESDGDDESHSDTDE